MPTITEAPVLTDADLVARSLAGDREAYAAIVSRHQSVICALTYSATGDRHQSEDLAQETFLAGWRSLGELKEPAHLRAWLRGIARNLTRNVRRKEGRVTAMSERDAEFIADEGSTPSDAAITREEHALLWQNLARLPEDYREPMVLYYRHGESTAAVAEALDISEDAARQRLSRGRAMLAERIGHLIDRGLRQGNPTGAFTLAIVSALPAVTATRVATTAVAGSGATKATMAGKLAAVPILAPLVSMVFGLYLAFRAADAQAVAPEERAQLRRFYRQVLLVAVAGVAVFAVLGVAGGVTEMSPRAFGLSFFVAVMVYVAAVFGLAWRQWRTMKALRARLLAADPSLAIVIERTVSAWTFRYRSRLTLLGLPLVHIHIGPEADLRIRPTVVAWIAIAPRAVGLIFAAGLISVAPLSYGLFSLGLLFSYGGVALAPYAIGSVAVGRHAIGIAAVSSSASDGIVALSLRRATGIAVIARHANDHSAVSYIASAPLFRMWNALVTHPVALVLFALLPVAVMVPLIYRAGRRARRGMVGGV